MKKFLSLVFIICLILPCTILLSACKKDDEKTPSYDYSLKMTLSENGDIEIKQPETYVTGNGTYLKYKALGNDSEEFLTWNNIPSKKEGRYYYLKVNLADFGKYEIGQPYTFEVERYSVELGYLNMIGWYKTYIRHNYGVESENDLQFTVDENGKFVSLSDYYKDKVESITTLYPLEECLTIGGSLIANNAFIVNLKDGSQIEFAIPLNFSQQIKTGSKRTGTAVYELGGVEFKHNYSVVKVDANVTSTSGNTKNYTINKIHVGEKQSVSLWNYYGTSEAVDNEQHNINFTEISSQGLDSIKHVKQLACYINLKAGDLEGFNNLETLIVPTTGLKIYELFNGNIPESLKTIIIYRSNSIPDYFFYGCSGIENVYMTSAVESVSDDAFAGLTNVNTLIVSGKFKLNTSHLTNIETIRVSHSTTNVCNNFLYKQDNVKNVYLPDSVTSIGNYSFAYMNGLESIRVSNSLKTINSRAFESNTFNGNIYFSNVTTVNSWAFQSSGFKKIEFSSRLSAMGAYAFYASKNLETVIMPSNVTLEVESALFGETNLKELHISGKSKIHDLFKNPNNPDATPEQIYTLEKLTVYGTVCNNFAKDLIISEKIIEITLDDSVKSIGSSAFENTNLFTTLKTNKVESIGAKAFFNNSRLVSITTTNSLTYVGEDAFKLNSFAMGKQMLVVGDGVLVNLITSSTTVDLKNENIKYIMAGAFAAHLEEITLGSSVVAIDKNAFADATSLKKLTLLSKKIDVINGDKNTNLFYNNSSLTNIFVDLTALSTYQNASYWNNYSNIFAPLPL